MNKHEHNQEYRECTTCGKSFWWVGNDTCPGCRFRLREDLTDTAEPENELEDCDFCGRASSDMTAGVCSRCNELFRFVNPGQRQPTTKRADDPGLEPTPYMRQLAERVLGNLNWIGAGTEPDVASDIISEALFLAAHDVRAGQCVELEYLGTIFTTTICGGTKMARIRPAPGLLEPLTSAGRCRRNA